METLDHNEVATDLMPGRRGPALSKFILTGRRNAWLEAFGMRVYVRNAIHCLNDSRKHYQTLDIANVEVAEHLRGQGNFKSWLSYAERMARACGKEAVYVESLLNPRLTDFLRRRGYSDAPNVAPECPCLYQLLERL